MKNKVIATVTMALKVKVDESSSSDLMPEWDSLGHMKIIMALEEEFDIEIEDEVLPNLISISTIVGYLSRK